MKFEGWRKAAHKAGRWFPRVQEGAELFMRNWHKTERRKAGERRAKAAAAPCTICRPSEQPLAILRISFQRPTYPPSDEPSSPSLAPLCSPYPQQAPQTSPSVADAPPPHVLRIPQTISSVCALSPLCSRKLSWQALRRTIVLKYTYLASNHFDANAGTAAVLGYCCDVQNGSYFSFEDGTGVPLLF